MARMEKRVDGSSSDFIMFHKLDLEMLQWTKPPKSKTL